MEVHYITKIKEIGEVSQQEDVDAARTTTPLNTSYSTGYRSESHERFLALLIPSNEKPALLCPKMEVEEIKQSPFKGKIIGYLDTENPLDKYSKTLSEMLVESEHLTVERQKKLTEVSSIEHYQDVGRSIKDLRNIKSEDKTINIKKVAVLADKCIEIGKSFPKEGVEEREVVNHTEDEIRKYGVNEMSFDTMVLFGDYAASLHGTPGDRKLRQNELVLFDLGAVYYHYRSNMARTIHFGTPNKEAQNIYNIVLKIETEATKPIKPGVTIKDIDKIVRDITEGAGYGDYSPHRLGHGLGLEEHEYQDISSVNNNQLEADMVITIEPDIYVPHVASARIEDNTLATENGYEILIQYEK